MTTRLRAIVLAASLIGMTPSSSPAGEEPVKEKAAGMVHYDRGVDAYELGDFRSAIDEFKLAYSITGNPALLFNLGQAYRRVINYRQALVSYHAYLRLVPDARNRADVEARIAEIERAAAVESAAPIERAAAGARNERPADVSPTVVEPPAPGEAAVLPAAEPRAAAAARRPPNFATALGYSALATATVSLGFGALLSARAAADSADLRGASVGTPWSAHDQAQYSEGRSATSGAVALYTVGAVLVACGVAAVVVGRHRPAPRARAGAGALWSF